MLIDRKLKYIILIWGVLTGGTVFLSVYAGDYIPYQKTWSKYLEFCSSDSFLGSVLGMLVSMYALVLPLTINIVSRKLTPYGDKAIVDWFKNRWEVYYQRVFLPIFMAYILLLLFADINNGFGCLVVLGFSIYTLVMSYKYFRTIIDISVDTETMIINLSANIAKSKLHEN
ncbi:MAG: hypothetical protein QE487_09335 [Fluviicola sp.]|nr:hypothetical protein [Fluviicola sp.]